MNVLGLDVSVRRTGWAVLDFHEGTVVGVGTIEPAGPLVVVLERIWRDVTQLASDHDLCDAALESGWAGRNGAVTRKLAQATGVARLAVWMAASVEPAEVPPATLKLFATGSGRAVKGEVVDAAVERWGVSPDSDVADALWCAEWVRRSRLLSPPGE